MTENKVLRDLGRDLSSNYQIAVCHHSQDLQNNSSTLSISCKYASKEKKSL